MAMCNHYTITRSDECPTSPTREFELPDILVPIGFTVVSSDYEGFGETGDRVQAYCFGEANARASIDALLAAREWLQSSGYTLSDSIINYGYSQGGQTTVAAIKLSQSEYRGKVHFMIGINDEVIGEGYAGETIVAQVPVGKHDVTILVRNEGLNAMNGVSSLNITGDVSLKVKYALFGKKASLVPADR
jgi:hypothetical protein